MAFTGKVVASVLSNVRAGCPGASRNALSLPGVSNQKPASELTRACRALSTQPREKYDYQQMRDGERVMEAFDVNEVARVVDEGEITYPDPGVIRTSAGNKDKSVIYSVWVSVIDGLDLLYIFISVSIS